MLSKQELLEKVADQQKTIDDLTRRLNIALEEKTAFAKTVSKLRLKLDQYTPKECPDCEEKSLVLDEIELEKTVPQWSRICYNCGYERLDDAD